MRDTQDPHLLHGNDELEMLYETALGLINRREVNSLLEAVMAKVAALMDTPHAFLNLVQPTAEHNELVLFVGTGIFAGMRGHRADYGKGLAGSVWASGELLMLEDYSSWANARAGFEQLGSTMALPLKWAEQVRGVFGVAREHGKRAFSMEEMNLLTRFGQMVSVVVENASLYAEVRSELEVRKQAEEALRASEERLHAVFEHAINGIFVINNEGTIVDVNNAGCQLIDHRKAELVGRSLKSIIPANRHGELHYLGRSLNERSTTRGEMQLERAGGALVEVEYTARANFLPGLHLVAFSDVTEHKALREQLIHQAYHDALTGLPNRSLFMDRLQQTLARSRRKRSATTVIFLDLDDFKVINDSLGHKAGDILLVEMGKRLRSCVRVGDSVARLGGDEFTVLLEDINEEEAEEAAERIASELRVPFHIEGCEVLVTASIGIACCEGGNDSPDDVLRNADTAMYEAKNRGKARYKVFHPSMNERAWERLQMEIDLRHALERNELVVYYQLVVDLYTSRVAEVEALVRWQHPQRGLVPPVEFIPVAEETGLILPIGQWVLEQACNQVRQWQDAYATDAPLILGVNLSLKQFKHPGLAEDIRCALRESGLDPHNLKLEITESAAMEDAEATISTLHELKTLGIQIAIDDFGTGYSALSYLKRFPVDTLKLDRSFVEGLGQDAENTAIVRAIIAFAKALHLTVTAEGIETYDQLQHLLAMDCDRGQGFHFARPLPPAELCLMFECPDKLRATSGPLSAAMIPLEQPESVQALRGAKVEANVYGEGGQSAYV